MEYNRLSNEELSKMVENILTGTTVDMNINNETGYVDEKAEAFIKSLKDMVK